MKSPSVFTFVFLLHIAPSYAESVEFPADWGQISNEHFDDVNCPSLNGQYSELGWSYNLENGKEANSDDMNTKPRQLIHKKEMKVSNETLSQDSFEITQSSSDNFTISILDTIFFNKVVSATFNRANGNLKCSDRWWVISDTDEYHGGSEGYSLNSSATRYLTRLSNGDLLVRISVVSERTDLFIFRNTNIFDTFYRYSKIQQ